MAEKNNSVSSVIREKLEKNKKVLLIATAIVIVMGASMTAFIYSTKNTIKSWENKIYPGVEVYGVSLGGYDKEQGLKIIEEQLIPKINEKTITITVGDKSSIITYGDIAPSYDAESILEDAIQFGKNESFLTKRSLIKKETKHELKPDVVIDEELLSKKEEEIRALVDIKPVNAKLIINGSTPSITEEQVGYTINAEEFHSKILESINGNPLENTQLTFELKETKPSITAEELSKVDGKISTFSTSYNRSSDLGRAKNLEVAVNYINGTVLMPGEVFSYADKIGQTTPEKGYQLANVYVADRVEKDYGGGVCQISTTLYRAVMGANLRSVERRNHSMTVGYAELGLDATYAYGYIDYKFKNNYDFPIYIQGYVTSNQVIFNIFGNQAGMGGKTYKMESEVLETIQPTTVREEDPTLLEGTEKVVSSGKVGYKVKSYQVTYENGVEVNREHIATDTYTAQNRVVKVGTKKAQKQESSQSVEDTVQEPVDEAQQP